MGGMEGQPNQAKTDEELLKQADDMLKWPSSGGYRRDELDVAKTAALISLASSALVIARRLVAWEGSMAPSRSAVDEAAGAEPQDAP